MQFKLTKVWAQKAVEIAITGPLVGSPIAKEADIEMILEVAKMVAAYKGQASSLNAQKGIRT